MEINSASGRALARAIANPGVNIPPPTPTAAFRHGGTNTAIRRCCAAWQRAFDAYLHKDKGHLANEFLAADHAGAAYRNAMPVLTGREGIRTFIACVAHGILIGAISEKRGGQLLYAAQVAMASIPRESKSPEKAVHRPPVPEKPVSSDRDLTASEAESTT